MHGKGVGRQGVGNRKLADHIASTQGKQRVEKKSNWVINKKACPVYLLPLTQLHRRKVLQPSQG